MARTSLEEGNYFFDQLRLSGLFRATGPQLKCGPRGPQSGPLAGPQLMWPFIMALWPGSLWKYFFDRFGLVDYISEEPLTAASVELEHLM